MADIIKLGFLASGSGSSVEEVIKKIDSGRLDGFYPEAVIYNREGAKVAERAKRLGVSHYFTPNTRDQGQRQYDIFKEHGVELILGLGYDYIVKPEVLDGFLMHVLNIHPTPLEYGGKGMVGLATHEKMIALMNEGKVTHTGPTIHLMTEKYDDPSYVLNKKHDILIDKDITPEELQKKVLPFEYELMAQTLELYRDNKLPHCKRP